MRSNPSRPGADRHRRARAPLGTFIAAAMGVVFALIHPVVTRAAAEREATGAAIGTAGTAETELHSWLIRIRLPGAAKARIDVGLSSDTHGLRVELSPPVAAVREALLRAGLSSRLEVELFERDDVMVAVLRTGSRRVSVRSISRNGDVFLDLSGSRSPEQARRLFARTLRIPLIGLVPGAGSGRWAERCEAALEGVENAVERFELSLCARRDDDLGGLLDRAAAALLPDGYGPDLLAVRRADLELLRDEVKGAKEAYARVIRTHARRPGAALARLRAAGLTALAHRSPAAAGIGMLLDARPWSFERTGIVLPSLRAALTTEGARLAFLDEDPLRAAEISGDGLAASPPALWREYLEEVHASALGYHLRGTPDAVTIAAAVARVPDAAIDLTWLSPRWLDRILGALHGLTLDARAVHLLAAMLARHARGELGPSDEGDLLTRLAEAYRRAGDAYRAGVTARYVVSAHAGTPAEVTARCTLAAVAAETGHWAEAGRELAAALSGADDAARPALALEASELLMTGGVSEAVPSILGSVRWTDQGEAGMRAGVLLYRAGRMRGAARILVEVGVPSADLSAGSPARGAAAKLVGAWMVLGKESEARELTRRLFESTREPDGSARLAALLVEGSR